MQFPIRVAFAMIINKSQGQTLQHVSIYFLAPVFSHGQLNVALPRVGNPNDVSIFLFKQKNYDHLVNNHIVCTKNIVYNEVLK